MTHPKSEQELERLAEDVIVDACFAAAQIQMRGDVKTIPHAAREGFKAGYLAAKDKYKNLIKALREDLYNMAEQPQQQETYLLRKRVEKLRECLIRYTDHENDVSCIYAQAAIEADDKASEGKDDGNE